MDELLLNMSQLARSKKINSLIGCEVESNGVIIGKVSRLRTDKYGRMDGLEVKPEDETRKHVTIPYNRIDGYVEARGIVKVSIPVH